MSHDIEEHLNELERNHKDNVKTAEALKRLRRNKDFKKVFNEQYMTFFAAEMVRKKADPNMQSVVSQHYITEQINAIGHLGQFFNVTLATGVNSELQLEEIAAEKSRLLNPEEYEEMD
jgi:hypothetical protein